jgi:Tol biopolymer transport system component
MKKATVALLLGVALAALAALMLLRAGPQLPAGLGGAIVFVSDRDGIPALYWRRLPRDRARRLTFGSEPASDPAVSPDGTRVAFAMNGRVAVVAVATAEVRVLTLGVDWKDAQPAWLADGRRLVVSARRRSGEPAGLHLLDPAPDGSLARSPLTQPRAGADTSPAPTPDGSAIVFVREERLMRVELADGRVRRLTGGFKRDRAPRFLPSGRIVCAWTEGKRHGVDAIDVDGRSRETLAAGGRFYRALAPSPDGRFLLATLGYDMGSRPLAGLFGRQREALYLLDTRGQDFAVLEPAAHSADWTR